eukprot:gene21839-28867_t
MGPASSGGVLPVFSREAFQRGSTSVGLVPSARRLVATSALFSSSADVEAAKKLMDIQKYRMVDVRFEKEYDAGHVTKPARSCFNAPLYLQDGSLNLQSVEKQAADLSKSLW